MEAAMFGGAKELRKHMPVSYDAATPIIAGFLLDLHFNIPAQSVCHIDAVQCRFLNDRPSFWPRMRKATSSMRRHQPIPDQHHHLTAMMRGHYAYYGITGNSRRLSWYAYQVARIWQKWLSRRDRGSRLHWRRFTALLKRCPLPAPRIVHRYTTTSEALP